ncbi:MAG: hypothetical protein ACREUQ_00430 [Burkholderiales bacterium]
MMRKIINLENRQPGLFDQDEPSVKLTPAQNAQLSMLVEALLIEIVAVLATGEASDEQDLR